MNDHELSALRYVVANEVLFHRGTWGGPAGYRWRGPDGTEAGMAPQWVTEALDWLAVRGLIATERRLGPLDVGIVATAAGMAAFSTTAAAA